MNLIEILLVSVGLSLDVYAVVVCQGSMLLKVEKGKLAKLCLLFCAWQVAAVYVGHQITKIPWLSVAADSTRFIWELVSVCLFVLLAVYMIYKAWVNEAILERLSDINYKEICIAAFFTSLDAFVAGLGFGFMETRATLVAICMFFVTAFVVILGLYTGYRIGFEQKRRAYVIGAILLLISVVELSVRYLA